MDSILTSIKKMLGIAEDYTHFDQDIIIHINTAFMTLNQLGVGPFEGFSIHDSTSKWNDFTSETNLEAVKTYVYIKVKLVFDPPSSGIVTDSLKDTAAELEWRLKAQKESMS